MRFPNKAARQDYLLKKEVEVGGKEVEWGDIKDAPVGDISKGVEAYGWGNHASAGYAKTKADVGLGNVDNTSDINKPVSTAVQTELNKKADKTDLFSGDYNDLTNKPPIPSQTDVNMGVTAYGWGDHSKAGYLKSIPKGVAVSDATDETEVLAQLNALLSSLRGAGLIAE